MKMMLMTTMMMMTSMHFVMLLCSYVCWTIQVGVAVVCCGPLSTRHDRTDTESQESASGTGQSTFCRPSNPFKSFTIGK